MRRMISQKDQNKIANISFGADTSSTVKYQLDSFEFVSGTTDNNSYLRFNIKKYSPAVRKNVTISGPMIEIAAGTVLVTGVEEAGNWDDWTSYTGSIECPEGSVVKNDSQGYICNIGGVKKWINYDASFSKVFYGANVSPSGVTVETGLITYTEGQPESYTIIKRKVVLSTAA